MKCPIFLLLIWLPTCWWPNQNFQIKNVTHLIILTKQLIMISGKPSWFSKETVSAPCCCNVCQPALLPQLQKITLSSSKKRKKTSLVLIYIWQVHTYHNHIDWKFQKYAGLDSETPVTAVKECCSGEFYTRKPCTWIYKHRKNGACFDWFDAACRLNMSMGYPKTGRRKWTKPISSFPRFHTTIM